MHTRIMTSANGQDNDIRRRSRPRNEAEAQVVVESDEDYGAQLRILLDRQEPWPDVNYGSHGLCHADDSVRLSTWDIIVLATYWTGIHTEYRQIFAQSSTRWGPYLHRMSRERGCELENEMARRVNQICDAFLATDVPTEQRPQISDLANLLEQIAAVWNLAPVAGLRWNEKGWVPTYRLARAVRRAAALVGMTEAQKSNCIESRVRWRSGRGFEYHDEYCDDIWGEPISLSPKQTDSKTTTSTNQKGSDHE